MEEINGLYMPESLLILVEKSQMIDFVLQSNLGQKHFNEGRDTFTVKFD